MAAHSIKPFESTGGLATNFVTHVHCDAKPVVTFLVLEHHYPAASITLYCLVTEAGVCVCERTRQCGGRDSNP